MHTYIYIYIYIYIHMQTGDAKSWRRADAFGEFRAVPGSKS